MRKTKLFFFVIVAVVFVGGCATAPQKPAFERTPGAPAPMSILGSEYVLPASLDVEGYEPEPGWVWLGGTDNQTTCEYGIGFRVVGDVSEHSKHISQWTLKNLQAYRDDGVKTEETQGEIPLLKGQAKIKTVALSKGGSKATKVYAFYHDPEETLAVDYTIYCEDAGLIKKTTATLHRFIESQHAQENITQESTASVK